MRIGRASRALAAAAVAVIVAAVVAAGCDALPDEQLLRFLGFREPGGSDNISVVKGSLFDTSTESVDAELQNATFTVGRNDDPGVGILVNKARVEYSLKGAPSYEFPVTLYLPAPESKGATTQETINGLPLVPEVLKQWIEGSGVQIHPSVRFTATVTFFARTDDGNDLEAEGSVAVELNDGGGSADVIVSIVSTDSTATEAPVETGKFKISRSGPTDSSLTVSYKIKLGSGQASNGTDYQHIDEAVDIPAGSPSATITITPIADANAEPDETVVLNLVDGSGYTVGSPSTATVTISD